MIRHNNWVVPWLPHTKKYFSVTGPFGSVSNLGVEENSFFWGGGDGDFAFNGGTNKGPT